MRNRIFAVLAIAILAGGGLAYGTYNVINNNQPSTAAAMPTQGVVVAKGDLVARRRAQAPTTSRR